MAAADITLAENACSIESDGTGAVISKPGIGGNVSTPDLSSMWGYLRNHGNADVWCLISITSTKAVLASVATTGAQAQLQVPLPAGGTLPWLSHYKSIAHKTAGGTATLSWTPEIGRGA